MTGNINLQIASLNYIIKIIYKRYTLYKWTHLSLPKWGNVKKINTIIRILDEENIERN